jgi:L-seryl-tRNA(Ser) seleniumtransferase
MLAASDEELAPRAERLAELVGAAAVVERGTSKPGGGTLPLTELEGPVCTVEPGPMGAEALAARLREADLPVISRIEAGRVVLDVRTVGEDEVEAAAAAVRRALD